MNEQRLEYALKLARLGFLIAPLKPNSKEPYYGESWKEMRTRNEATIRGWFEHRPSMNYLVCGGDNFVIIDPDGAQGIELFHELGDAGATLVVETPNNGQHWYYRTPHPVTNSNTFPDGIDVRGHNGYVVGPLSQLEDGRTWRISELSFGEVEQAPDWIVKHCRGTDFREQEDYEFDREAVDYGDVVEVLSKLDPDVPYPEWKDVAISLKATKILHPAEDHYSSRQMWHRWSAGEFWTDESVMYEEWKADFVYDTVGGPKPGGRHWGSLVYEASQHGYDGKYAHKKAEPEESWSLDTIAADFDDDEVDPGEEPEDEEENPWKKRIYFGEEINKIKVAPHLINEWLPNRGVTGLIAFRGHGKTVAMVDLLLRLAVCSEDNPQNWGKTPLPEDMIVVYMCGEDPENTAGSHIKAWCQEFNDCAKPERFVFIDGVPNLLKKENTKLLLEAIVERLVQRGFAEQQEDGRVRFKKKIIVGFDTWQRGTIGLSQLEDSNMSTAVVNAEAIGASLGDCPVLVAFHPPKAAKLDPKALTISGTGQLENVTTAIWHLFPAEPDKLPVTEVNLIVDRIKGPGAGNYREIKYHKTNLKGEFHPTTEEPLTGITIEYVASGDASEAQERAKAKAIERATARYTDVCEKILQIINDKDHEGASGDSVSSFRSKGKNKGPLGNSKDVNKFVVWLSENPYIIPDTTNQLEIFSVSETPHIRVVAIKATDGIDAEIVDDIPMGL